MVSPIVDRALAAANKLRRDPLGVTVDAWFPRASGVESPLSNLIADLIRSARPTADIALTHAGGLRADLEAGPLQYGAFYETYPRR